MADQHRLALYFVVAEKDQGTVNVKDVSLWQIRPSKRHLDTLRQTIRILLFRSMLQLYVLHGNSSSHALKFMFPIGYAAQLQNCLPPPPSTRCATMKTVIVKMFTFNVSSTRLILGEG